MSTALESALRRDIRELHRRGAFEPLRGRLLSSAKRGLARVTFVLETLRGGKLVSIRLASLESGYQEVKKAPAKIRKTPGRRSKRPFVFLDSSPRHTK